MKYLRIVFVLLFVTSCSKQNNRLTNPNDYDSYLKTSATKTTSKYFELWNSKIEADSTQLLSFSNVAAEYNRYFKNTGDITYLKKAERALTKAVDIANLGKASYARALARNYISQHRFKEALQMAEMANQNGGGKKDTQALLFDIHMELGNYASAEKYLDSIKNMADFGYLIRNAKWNDYQGNLETTITFMEKALEKAESSNNKRLKIWSYTNLADYYGHAGRIQDSYNGYLKALKLDPSNAYAKKGIAWIVFSYEKNAKEALRILDAVTENYNSPDYYVLKAEIHEFLNDAQSALKNRDAYHSLVQNPNYGEMYNSYNIDYYLDCNPNYSLALDIALKEVENRPTAESFSFLAKTYAKMNELDKALNIVETQIIGNTFEPGILLNVAEIYKLNGQYNKVKKLKEELEEATYELGPVSEQTIKML